jgi:hypothetical protein
MRCAGCYNEMVTFGQRTASRYCVDCARDTRHLTADEQKAMQSALRKSTKLIAKGQRI